MFSKSKISGLKERLKSGRIKPKKSTSAKNFKEQQEKEAAFDFKDRGLRIVPLDQITGSVGRYHELDSKFRLSPHTPPDRLLNIKKAKPFDSLDEARTWVAGFQHWYNEVHRHSALKFVTPGQRHRGEDIVILEQRHLLYEAAKISLPGRWSRKTRDWTPIQTVYLNPGKSEKKGVGLKQNAA